MYDTDGIENINNNKTKHQNNRGLKIVAAVFCLVPQGNGRFLTGGFQCGENRTQGSGRQAAFARRFSGETPAYRA